MVVRQWPYFHRQACRFGANLFPQALGTRLWKGCPYVIYPGSPTLCFWASLAHFWYMSGSFSFWLVSQISQLLSCFNSYKRVVTIYKTEFLNLGVPFSSHGENILHVSWESTQNIFHLKTTVAHFTVNKKEVARWYIKVGVWCIHSIEWWGCSTNKMWQLYTPCLSYGVCDPQLNCNYS